MFLGLTAATAPTIGHLLAAGEVPVLDDGLVALLALPAVLLALLLSPW